MIDITDKISLERKFAEDFSTPYFPILADLYLQEGDLTRAKKVCKIGLDYDSSNSDGKFIFAKAALAEKKFTLAEKWLKQVVKENPVHINAYRQLIRLEFDLQRSKKTIQNYIETLLRLLPNDPECMDWNKNNPSNDQITQNSSEEPPPANEETQKKIPDNKKNEPKELSPVESIYEVKSYMATFTMVQVLRSQKQFQQALETLKVLESKNSDKDRIYKERGEIEALLDVEEK